MRAVYFDEHGDIDKLIYTTDYPEPEISDDEILVKVCATSVNHADFVIRRGYPGLTLPLPHIAGGDIAGEVFKIGKNVTDFSIGERVMAWPLVACGECELCKAGQENICLNWQYFGMHRHGGYAEFVNVPAKSLVKLPENVSYDQAIACGVAGLTAFHAIHGVGKLLNGETFFIWGGSGGLGTMAVQIAKSVGATVIATVGKESKKELLYKLGADFVFNHYDDDVQAEVMKLRPNGVEMIIDYVGPATFGKSFNMLRKGGRVLLCGIISGRETNVSLHLTYLRHLSILGLYLGTKQELEQLLALVSIGEIKPVLSQKFPLEDAQKAQRMLAEGGCVGKIIIEI